LRDRIGVMLGGRVAGRLIFGEVTTGAQEDLKQATRLARHMVPHWGMSAKLGPVAYQRSEEHVFLGKEMEQQKDYSETTGRIIDEEVMAVVKQTEQGVTRLLETHRSQLQGLAETLMRQEAEEIAAIVKPLPAEQNKNMSKTGESFYS
jgi:cell division protease FtsH